MRRPFWLIDGRLREADFFLERLKTAATLDDARHYFSAFLTAFVSVFDATDRTLREISGFADWWNEREEDLLSDPAIAYLWRIRNQIVHEGLNPLGGQTRGMFGSEFYLRGDNLPSENAVNVCYHAMNRIIKVAGETYSEWWTSLDIPDTYTHEQLESENRTLEMIELEFGLTAGDSAVFGASESERLHFLKTYSRTAVTDLQAKYPTRSDFAREKDDCLQEVIARRRKHRDSRK